MQTRELRLVVNRSAMSIDTLHTATGERASRVRQFVVRPGENEDEEVVTVSFVRLSRTSVDAIAKKLRADPGVRKVELTDA